MCNLLTIFHVLPLDIFPCFTAWWILSIFISVVNISRPGYTLLIDVYLGTIAIFQFKSVIEKTLCNESTWYSWIIEIHINFI